MSVMMTQMAPVLFGEGAVNELGDKMKEFGCKKALCIYDKGIDSCGIGDRVLDIIKGAGLEVEAFKETAPEPPDYQIDNVYNEYKDAGIDVVIGLGGGSCMDTAKGVAFMFTHHPASVREHLIIGPDSLWGDFPLILIPTASGTGSEVSPVAVITDTSAAFKGGVLVHTLLAILDPELTKSAPPFVTATSGMDAFSHAAEGITSCHFHPMAEIQGVKAIQNIVKYLPIATHEGSNMEARSAMSIASNFAGMAFTSGMVHMGHGLAETIGAIAHQPHGLCCALCIAPAMEYVGEVAPDRIKVVADAMGIDYSEFADDGVKIGLAVGDAIRKLLRECEVPSFKDRGLTREEIMAMVPEMTTNFHMLDCPTKVDEEIVAKYAARIWDCYE